MPTHPPPLLIVHTTTWPTPTSQMVSPPNLPFSESLPCRLFVVAPQPRPQALSSREMKEPGNEVGCSIVISLPWSEITMEQPEIPAADTCPLASPRHNQTTYYILSLGDLYEDISLKFKDLVGWMARYCRNFNLCSFIPWKTQVFCFHKQASWGLDKLEVQCFMELEFCWQWTTQRPCW